MAASPGCASLLAATVNESELVPQRLWGVWGSNCSDPTVAIGAKSIGLMGVRDESPMPVERVEEMGNLIRVHFSDPKGWMFYEYNGDEIRGLSVFVGGQELRQNKPPMKRRTKQVGTLDPWEAWPAS